MQTFQLSKYLSSCILVGSYNSCSVALSLDQYSTYLLQPVDHSHSELYLSLNIPFIFSFLSPENPSIHGELLSPLSCSAPTGPPQGNLNWPVHSHFFLSPTPTLYSSENSLSTFPRIYCTQIVSFCNLLWPFHSPKSRGFFFFASLHIQYISFKIVHI